MKKVISVILALCLVFTLAACGKKDDTTNTVDSFVKPNEYVSVLLLTINPQFKLYLDANEKVIAIEPVNDDAKAMQSEIDFENKDFETVIKDILTVANEKDFVKEGATVKLELVESTADENTNLDILTKAENATKDTANTLKTEITVTTNKEAVVTTTEEAVTEPTSTEETTKEPANNTPSETNTPSTTKVTTTKAPSHTHNFAPATCTSPKKCSCGATEGKALGHSYKNGVCTRCSAVDPNYLTPVAGKSGTWSGHYLKNGSMYDIQIKLVGTTSIAVNIGQLVSTLPESMQNDPNIDKDCKVIDGEKYYFGMGTGEGSFNVAESGKTVTLTNASGEKIVFTRTGENTLKCTSSSKFGTIGAIPVGTVFTFGA